MQFLIQILRAIGTPNDVIDCCVEVNMIQIRSIHRTVPSRINISMIMEYQKSQCNQCSLLHRFFELLVRRMMLLCSGKYEIRLDLFIEGIHCETNSSIDNHSSLLYGFFDLPDISTTGDERLLRPDKYE